MGARVMRRAPVAERIVFDPLEPRLLLNADVLSLNLAHETGLLPVDHSLIVELVNATEQVNNQSVAVQRVQIVDQSNGNAVLAFGDLSQVSAIAIAGGTGNTTLTIDEASFGNTTAPKISFTGGSGQNTVVFDNPGATNWTLTGANAGEVAGGGVDLTFSGVQNLSGAGGGANTLTVDQGGTLSGVFDGGAGGKNALIFDNGQHTTETTSVGPQYDTISLDGQALNFADVQSITVDPQNVSFLGSNDTGTLSWNAGNHSFQLDESGHATQYFAEPQSQPAPLAFNLTLLSGDKLTVNTLNFNTEDSGASFNILGDGASIEFAGNITDSAGVSATVTSSDTQSITASQLGSNSIVPQQEMASITVDQGVTITGSTISLIANSSSQETITNTDTSAKLVTSDSIAPATPAQTTNSAQVTVNGTLDATGAVVLQSNVTVNDSIDNSDALLLTAVTVTTNNASGVTLSSTATVDAATLDAEANTNVNVTITADHVGAGIGNGLYSLPVTVNDTNTTTVTVDLGASVAVGAGTVSASQPDAAFLAATDNTNVTTALTLDDPAKLPVFDNVLLFSAVDSADNLSRTTSVTVGDPSATQAPSTGAPDTLYANGGDIALVATSGGAISNTETSTSLGSVEINATGASDNGDVTSVELSGVNVSASGLSLSAVSATNYLDFGHLSTITVDGGVQATVSDSNISVLGGGLSVEAQDNSTLSTSSVAPNFDPATATQVNSDGSGSTSAVNIGIDRTSSIITVDKIIDADIAGSTVSSGSLAVAGGDVRVQAVDNKSLSSDAIMVADATTSGDTSGAVGGMLAANIVNGSVSATISNSAVTTTKAGDVQVLAGDSSTVTSRAETSSVASSTSTSISASGTIALNAIGWTITPSAGGLAEATLGTILGSSAFWTDNAPADVTNPGTTSSNVTASITNAQLSVAGALVVQAIASETVNAIVTNVSQSTSTSNGDGTAAAVGGVAGSNRVSRAATAFLNQVTPKSSVLAAGAITVDAQNNASITSNSTLVTSAVSALTDPKTTYVSTQKPGNADNTPTVSANKAQFQQTTTLNFGDTILYKATYTTANLFGTGVPKMATINTGDTVYVDPASNYPSAKGVSGQVYEYVGTTSLGSVDLEQQDYTTADWKAISVIEGAVYKFMGPSGTAVNLADGTLYDGKTGAAIKNAVVTTPDATDSNYYDLGYWYQVPKAQLQSSSDSKSGSGSSTGASVGGIVVLNEVHSGAYAIVENSTVKGASLAVTANDNETITATLDATATASAASGYGSGNASDSSKASTSTGLAVNGSIAINEILGNADAHILDSSITTTSGDVDVEATNSSTITASTASAVSSSGGNSISIGVILADNTIGADFQKSAQFHSRYDRRR